MSLIPELKRRHIFRVALLYVVSAWAGLQVAEFIFQLLAVPGWAMQALVGLAIVGLPLVLVFAWAFEVTPDGVRRESDFSRSEADRQRTVRRLNVGVIAVTLLGIGMLALDRLVPEPHAAASEGVGPLVSGSTRDEADAAAPDNASIAVLPFEDLSPGGDQEYFSDGISEEILNLLVGVDGLSVISRTSSFRFKEGDQSIPVIARELGVAHVLEGSVRKAGDRIRVTAQLIAAESDVHLWSDTYEGELTVENIFEIQDEIAREIVDVLRRELSATLGAVASVDVSVEDLDAYELYQRARNPGVGFGVENHLAAIDLLERATAIAPDYAEAWADLAATYAVLPGWSPEYSANVWLPRAVEAVERALDVNPELPSALSARGRIHASLMNWARANDDLAAAYDRAPDDATILFNYGIVLLQEGYIDRSLPLLERAVATAPDDGFNWMFYGMALAADGQSGAALEALTRAYLLGYRGSVEAEISALLLEAGDHEAHAYVLANWYERANYADVARYVARVLRAPRAERSKRVDQFWEVVQALGFDKDYMLAQSARWDDDGLPFQHSARMGHPEVMDSEWPDVAYAFVWGPGLGEGRRTAGFKAMLRNAGLPAFWREHGWPDRCRPIGSEDFECD